MFSINLNVSRLNNALSINDFCRCGYVFGCIKDAELNRKLLNVYILVRMVLFQVD